MAGVEANTVAGAAVAGVAGTAGVARKMADLPVNGWWSLLLLLTTTIVLITRLWIPLAMRMLERGGLVATNFQGQRLPIGMGLGFLVPLLAVLGLATGIGVLDIPVGLSLLFALSALAFLGFVDDVCGDHSYRGWAGHWRALRRESLLTTGLFKAAGGGLVALVVSAAGVGGADGPPWVSAAVRALFLALATNSLNLFDIRPGRAIKAFVITGLLPLAVLLAARPGSAGSQVGAVLLWTAAAVLVYAPRDLQAKVMMGDTGANPLGFVLGVGWVTWLPFRAELAGVAALLWFQQFAGRVSLSRVISRHAWLARLDEWGRPPG